MQSGLPVGENEQTDLFKDPAMLKRFQDSATLAEKKRNACLGIFNEVVKDKRIAGVAMTAEWEIALQKIENNEAAATDFHQSMKAYASSVTKELLSMSIAGQNHHELTCPICNAHKLLIRDKIVECPDEACNWLQFPNVGGVRLSLTEIENLLNKRMTNLIKGMKSKAGRKFDAYIILKDDCKRSFEFEKQKIVYTEPIQRRLSPLI